MLDTIIAALLPIILTLLLGLLAGWHKDFNLEQAGVLNRMVMLYALPLSLFSGMMQISRHELLSDGYLLLLVSLAMLGGFAVAFLISWKVFHRDRGTAALQALAVSGPAVPFVGVPVLGFLFGVQSTVAVTIGSIFLNMIQVPVCIVILSMNVADKKNANTSGTLQGGSGNDIAGPVLSALKEPVVWVPFLALVIVFAGVKLPKSLVDSLALLGHATGGVALFASGVILFAQRVKIGRPVVASVIARNILVPLVVLLMAALVGAPKTQAMEAVLSMAIPTASIVVMLAVQYKTAEQEMASTLFLSTLLSVLTMGAFIWFLH